MKKNIILSSLLLGFILISCEDNKEQYLDQFSTITYFRNSGIEDLTLYKTGMDTDYNVIVNKAGSNLQTATSVNVLLMSDVEVNYYNQQNATNYHALPANCYQIKGGTTLNFEPGETYKKVEIVFKTNTIDHLINSSPNQEYILPLQLGESTDSINSNKKTLFIKPQVLIPTIYFEKRGMDEHLYDGDGTDKLTYSYQVGMSIKNQWAFDSDIVIDEKAIDDYNKNNGTDYKLLDKEAYTIPTTLSFVPAANSVEFEVKIDCSKLSFGAYALPMKLSKPSNENFAADDNTLIFGVVYKAPKIPLRVDMLYCNHPQGGSEGNLASLLDDDIKTYFHSSYATNTPKGHYLQVNLDEPTQSFQYSFTTRETNGNGNPVGTVVQVSADGETFIEVAHITRGLPTGAKMVYLSPIFKPTSPFKHIRLINDGAQNGRNYFVFSEFSLYGK